MPSVGLRVAAFREKYEELVMCRHHDKEAGLLLLSSSDGNRVRAAAD
jgi:hypothetical protein